MIECSFDLLIEQMSAEYIGTEYNLFHRNCCTFCKELCLRAGVPAHVFPSYVSSLGENIAGISSMVGLADCGAGGKVFGGDNEEIASEMGDSSYYTDTEDEVVNK